MEDNRLKEIITDIQKKFDMGEITAEEAQETVNYVFNNCADLRMGGLIDNID